MVTEVTATLKRPILLAHFEFDSGSLRLWNGAGDLTWDGETWTGSGTLLKVSRVTETTDIRAVGLQFVLTGVPSAILDLVDGEDYQGRPAYMWVGMLDSAGAVVADPKEIFRGFMDVMTDEDDGETATVTLDCENEIITGQRAKEWRWTSEDQKLIDSDDTFCDYVADLQEKEITGG